MSRNSAIQEEVQVSDSCHDLRETYLKSYPSDAVPSVRIAAKRPGRERRRGRGLTVMSSSTYEYELSDYLPQMRAKIVDPKERVNTSPNRTVIRIRTHPAKANHQTRSNLPRAVVGTRSHGNPRRLDRLNRLERKHASQELSRKEWCRS